MAAVGRGRGRGRGALSLNKETKPGSLVDEKGEPIDELTVLISKLSLRPNEAELKPLEICAEKAARSSKAGEAVVGVIYKRCLTDWRYSSPCAKLCNRLLHIQCEGSKFRDIVLRTIQADFKNKDVLRGESPSRYLGSVAFMCELYLCMRDEKGEPFTFMSTPIQESLQLLLDNKATDNQLMCASTQLLHVGRMLYDYGDKTRLAQLRKVLKDKILDNCGTREIRLLMVNLLECMASDWTLHQPPST